MAYGKFRDGPTSVGRSASNYLQDGRDDTFMTRRRPGVLVRKSGDFTNIFKDQEKLDGFYSLGALAGGGTRIVGSLDGFSFTDRGPAPEQGGFTVTQLGFYGAGLGVVTKPSANGAIVNFDSRACQAFRYELLRTRNGRRLVDYYEFPTFIPTGRQDTLIFIARGGYWFDGTGHKFYAGAHAPMVIGGQQVQTFITDDGKGAQGFGAVEYFINQLGWYATPLTLAPGVLMKMDRYLRPAYEPSSIDVAGCPGLYFCFSADAGKTWQTCSASAMWTTELLTVTGLPENLAGATQFNKAVQYADIVAAPLNRRNSVCVASVPYYTPGPIQVLQVRVKLGVIDAESGCAMTESMVLFDGDPDDATIYRGRGLLAIPGGVLIFTRDVITGPNKGDDAWRYPAQIRITRSGFDIADWAVMPMKESYTGSVTGYDTRTMVCPMWDGRHSLYRSRDFGRTWVRAGTISTRGVPPNDDPQPSEEQFTLKDFGVITYLQKDDAPANADPLTPWLTDSRLPAPQA